MTPSVQCPRCGGELPADRPEGLCPGCLLRAAIEVDEPSPAPDPRAIAALFPELEIIGLLGRGGMGVVYQVRQPALERFAALKVLPSELAESPGFRQRFQREARTLAGLNHPHIVTLHEFGERDGHFFFLMEFVDGGDLGRIIGSGTLSPREALAIVPQICEALQYAHDKGVVHRDIKPGNILLDQQGRVKIADFGVAKLVGRAGDPGVPRGYAIGTPAYMAPEQRGESSGVDHRADIYSLGAVLYELLTGSPPGETIEPPSRRVKIDIRLDEVVLRAMEREPERRYQQVSEFREGVERIAGPRRRRSGPAAIALTAMAGAAAVGVAWMMQRPPPAPADPFPPAWKNSLGMAFRPIPGSTARMSIWETRESDWEAFERGGENSGRHAVVRTNPDHPVTSLDRDDAEAFCRWLTRVERAAGTIRANENYRLPTDQEWSRAVGLDEPADAGTLPPDQRDRTSYPWGKRAPAPPGAGNYSDVALQDRMTGVVAIPSYYDGHAGTAPVGSFPPNEHGFHDLGGNVWEYVAGSAEAVGTRLRGGSWAAGSRDGDWSCLLSSAREDGKKAGLVECGFRTVLAPAVTAEVATLLDASRDGDLSAVQAMLASGARVDERDAREQTALHLAAREGRAEVVAALIKAGAKVDAPDRDGQTPLHAAAASGSLATVTCLVEAGADVRAKSRLLRWEPFHWAAQGDHPEVLAYLLDRGAEIDHRDAMGCTALYHAVGANGLAAARWLLDHGAEPDLSGRSAMTPLVTAALQRRADMVTLLLDRSASVNLSASNEVNPLAAAVILGDSEIAEILLKRGADATAPGIGRALGYDWGAVMKLWPSNSPAGMPAPLMMPPEPGARARIVRLLHAHGFQIEQRDPEGYTPLLTAAYRGSTEVFQALVELGADLHAVDGAGFSALHSAIEQRAERIAEILIARGADIEAVTRDGRRPLEIAAARGELRILDLLIKAGAGIEARDKSWGATALLAAAWHGRQEAVARLIAAGADVQTRSDNHKTALMSAAAGLPGFSKGAKSGASGVPAEASAMSLPQGGSAADYTACVRLLLDGGAHPRAVNPTDGCTALHYAAAFNQADAMVLLLDAGAPVDTPNHAGETALHAAARSDSLEAAKLLLDRKASLAPPLGTLAPLHAAARGGGERVGLLLLEAGADANLRDGHGATPLHEAVNGNHPGMVRLLAKHGADLAARNYSHVTPLHMAVAHDDLELIRTLRLAGADTNARSIEGNTPADLARSSRKPEALAALLEAPPVESPKSTPSPASR